MNIEEENKLMLQAVRDIETICLGAQHTQPDNTVASHDHFVAALRDIAKILCDQAKQRIFDPPPLGSAGAPQTPLSEKDNPNQVKIGTLPVKFIHGDGYWTGFAVNSQRQVYNVTVRNEKPTEDTITGTFSIDGEERIQLSGTSFRRVLICTLAASNAYIATNVRSKERRHRARERRKAGGRELKMENEGTADERRRRGANACAC